MPDLEQVDRRKDPSVDEDGLDRRLGIPGQQRVEPAVAEEHDQRAVVDVALRQGSRRIGVGGIQDLDGRGPIQHELLAGPCQHHRGRRLEGGIV
ncbi:MAG TPA: hypothetical protein VF364_01025, partial [Candidatus Limnocylindria bacterium]